MTFQEKTLYHQIHPLKLFTDWSTGIAALYPFWRHDLLTALLLAMIPPMLVSLTLIHFADLERYQQHGGGHGTFGHPGREPEATAQLPAVDAAAGGGFFTVTGFHGFHVFIGLCLVTGLIIQTVQGKSSAAEHMRIEIFGLYWHFVDVVWIILFTIIYLL